MCGIAGFFEPARARGRDDLELLAGRMCDRIRHRGPDDSGVWTDESSGLALGHRRLSILDPSPAGHQPMRSACGRHVLTFNGEIYNFASLRRELEELGHGFRGGSDTEMMLAAFVQWGVPAALKRFVGMFAFALWDAQDHELHLGRDRLGEKPLYYGWCGGTFLFGSELKALRAHPDWDASIDRDALALYIRRGYLSAPYSIYRGIFKLPPGSTLTLPVGGMRGGNRGEIPEPSAYWSFRDIAEQGLTHPFSGSDDEARDELDKLLRSAVAGQMVADVPLGAFLSGGIDSSTIVALMQAQSTRPVKTFTIGFPEREFNEAEHARAVAKHLGTDHTELYITAAEAMAVIPKLPEIYDEPFFDPSQIPTFLVSSLARRHVTVSLSGDGGDELFCGYERYLQAARIWRLIKSAPLAARRGFGKLLTAIPAQTFDAVIQALALKTLNSHRIRTLAKTLSAENKWELYTAATELWTGSELVLNAQRPASTVIGLDPAAAAGSFEEQMMALDSTCYLPDDILVKVDRASMAVSLESRVPLLDHRVVEFAWRIPIAMKFRDGRSKWLLRQVLDRYVPRVLIDRPKMGFGIPVGAWLRGPLRDWSENLLAEERLKSDGWFDPAPIRQKWAEHLSGRQNWQTDLWCILMFQAWFAARAQSP